MIRPTATRHSRRFRKCRSQPATRSSAKPAACRSSGGDKTGWHLLSFVMAGLVPAMTIHSARPCPSKRDRIGSRACPTSALIRAASRINPTCGDKPGDDSYREAMSDWVKFYDFKHSVIYVNARHRDVHYRRIAEDIRTYVPSPTAHMLDYGCGEATSADLVADVCAQLVLVEAAPNVRASLTMR